MPIIRNIEKNVMFKLDLLNNRYLDIKKKEQILKIGYHLY